MKIKFLRIASLLLIAVSLCLALAGGADAAANSRKKKYNKNYMPPGWKYEVGYFLWRTDRGFAATPATWKKYMREKDRRAMQGKDRGVDSFVLRQLDWTVEELAEYLAEQRRLHGDD